LAGIEFGGTAQFVKRLVGSLKPQKCQAERVMKAGILRRSKERGPQYTLTVGLPPKPAIKIGKVGRGGRILRAQPQRSFVFGLRFGRTAALRKEAAEGRARFRPIGIEALSVDELGRRALKPFPIGGRLVRGRNHGEQRGCPDAHAAAGIGEKRRSKWPNLSGRYAFEYIESADPNHWVGVRQACARRVTI